MAKQLQLRRGNTVQNNAFIGAVGEPTLDTETGLIHIHDGVTQGGKEFIDAVVAFQRPTAENNYTWFRKYASGWVEQGGLFTVSVSSRFGYVFVPLAVTMADNKYNVFAQGGYIDNVSAMAYTVNEKTTTQFRVQAVGVDNASAAGTPQQPSWYVCGFAA